MNSREKSKLIELAAQLRKHIISMNCYAGSGHPDGYRFEDCYTNMRRIYKCNFS
jgi:hypothetical protein